MEFRVRRAEKGDGKTVAHLVRSCFDRPWSEAAVEGALIDRSARAWIAVEAARPDGPGPPTRGEAVVGFVLARRITDQVEIDLVGVLPASRRRGIAGVLLRALIEEESRAGAAELRLELSAGNRAAAALYAELGFVVVGRRSRYYPDGSDALLLTRRLA